MQTSPTGPPLRAWAPPDARLQTRPAWLARAVRDVVSPAYNDLVYAAPSGLEGSLGSGYLYAVWLELLEHAAPPGAGPDAGGGAEPPDGRVGRHLRAAAARHRAATLLLAAQKFFDRLSDIDPLRRVPR